jgi:hypothetical protein
MPLPVLLILLAQGADPALDVKVDVRVKIAPIDEALAELGRAAHLSLETAPAIRDLKATILVDKIPVGRVMARLADVLRLQWKKETTGYRLVNDPDAAAREAAYLKGESDSKRNDLERRLKNMAAVGRISFGLVVERADEVRKALAKMKSDDPNYQNTADLFGALNNAQNLDYWLQGKLLSKLNPNAWARLMNGEPMSASTKPTGAGIALPAEAVNYRQWPGDQGRGMKRTRMDIFMRVDPDGWDLQVRGDQEGDEGQGNSMSIATGNDSPGGLDGTLHDSAFARELNAWTQDPFTDPAAQTRTNTKIPEKASEWWSDYRSSSDQLEWLHDATGVPIVAMACRVPNRRSSLAFDGTVADYVKAWRGSGTFRMDDGFLMHRPEAFWFIRRREIPEAILRPLEAKPAPTVDDYADFVSRISDRQAQMAGNLMNYLLRVSPYPMSDGTTALRLWGTLSKPQRAILRGGAPIPFEALGGPARTAFAQAITNVFDGAWHLGPMSARFTGASFNSFAGWGILAETKDVKAISRSRPRPLDERDVEFKQEPESEGMSLLLGMSKDDAVRYTLPLAGLPKKR